MAQIKKITPKFDKNEPNSSSKIEVIKNLIFGDHIKEYDSEFELLKKDIFQKKEELENLIDQVGNELKSSIDNLSTDINIRLTSLEDKLETLDSQKIDHKDLGNILIKLGEKIGKD